MSRFLEPPTVGGNPALVAVDLISYLKSIGNGETAKMIMANAEEINVDVQYSRVRDDVLKADKEHASRGKL